MNIEPDLPKVALIAGPTASGKSAVALTLAERMGGTIVNADASQVYRDLRVLTARPTAEEEARAPHHLFGTQDAGDALSAAGWAAQAARVIDGAVAAGRLPILVGGSGLYIRTLLHGIAPVPDIDPVVREAVRALPVATAYTALAAEDPVAAARLRPTDTTRIARALEVVRATGRPLGHWQAERHGGIGGRIRIAGLVLLPPRAQLHERVATRFAQMMDAGAVEEVRVLLARKLDPALPAMRAIGVREIGDWLHGQENRADAVTRGIIATRRYAKRQYTWFRHQSDPEWLVEDGSIHEESALNNAILLQHMLLTR